MTSRQHNFNWVIRNLFLIALACITTVAQTPSARAQNVDDNNIFELDGNTQDATPNPPGDDWQSFFPSPGTGSHTTVATPLIQSFVAEGLVSVSIFTQGGSKDTNGIGQWRHADGSVPPKDQLENGFAAAYEYDGQLLLYFGADRYANNGDANIGLWFLQSNMGLKPDGSFSGAHQDGDIFVVAGFTRGGQTSAFDVYKWVGDDATGSLVLQTALWQPECSSSDGGTLLRCAITNSGGQTSGWAYTPKSGTPGTYPVASFFEGGLNVTDLIGGETPCFSTFILETRSSTSDTAQLEDFIRGSFELCGVKMT